MILLFHTLIKYVYQVIMITIGKKLLIILFTYRFFTNLID